MCGYVVIACHEEWSTESSKVPLQQNKRLHRARAGNPAWVNLTSWLQDVQLTYIRLAIWGHSTSKSEWPPPTTLSRYSLIDFFIVGSVSISFSDGGIITTGDCNLQKTSCMVSIPDLPVSMLETTLPLVTVFAENNRPDLRSALLVISCHNRN